MHMTVIFGNIVVLVCSASNQSCPVLLLLKTYTDISAPLDKHEREEHPDESVRYL